MSEEVGVQKVMLPAAIQAGDSDKGDRVENSS